MKMAFGQQIFASPPHKKLRGLRRIGEGNSRAEQDWESATPLCSSLTSTPSLLAEGLLIRVWGFRLTRVPQTFALEKLPCSPMSPSDSVLLPVWA